MLQEKVSEALKAGRFSPAFCALPTISDREKWNSVDAEVKAYYLGLGRNLLEKEPAPLPASYYCRFLLYGERIYYDRNFFDRRNTLMGLLVCECLTDEGKYLSKIIDFIWAICEETTWVIPAHVHGITGADNKPRYLVGPDMAKEYIDLFAAETASLLSWCLYMLGERLDAITPVIRERVLTELHERIFTVFHDHPEMHWVGKQTEYNLNNWTPWIYSNVLMSALLSCRDGNLRDEIILGTGEGIDAFLKGYSEDGCCDEGPSYFDKAGASVIDTLEELYLASGGAVDLYREPLIRAMTSYIIHVWVDGTKFVNFADCAPNVLVDTMVLKRGAQRMGLTEVIGFADYLAATGNCFVSYSVTYDSIFRKLTNILTYRRAEAAPAPELPLSHAFPGTQVATVREKKDGSGLFLAMKGGHNRESHNHNDIGSYCVWLNGEPLICDVGVGAYTKDTFNDKRYTIWTMQSGYHNTAILNGCDQQPGRDFRAKDFSFSDDGNTAVCSMDIAGAYGGEAGIGSYQRAIAIDRSARTVSVSDVCAFRESGTLTLPLMCAVKPEEIPGALLLKGNSGALRVTYDESAFTVTVEEIPLTDEALVKKWHRNTLYRALFRVREEKSAIEAVLRFTAE